MSKASGGRKPRGECLVSVKLLFSIDTESDHWRPNRGAPTFANLEVLPTLGDLCARVGLRPTWLCTYSVLRYPRGVELLRDLRSLGEVGAHLHPWTTPPVEEPLDDASTMLCNLSLDLQRRKLRSLDEAFEEAFGGRPTVFRAGRWGLGDTTVQALVEAGYQVDSSVTPFVSWAEYGGPDFGEAPSGVHRRGGLIEIPVSVGYTHLPFDESHRRWQALRRPALRPFRVAGLASRLNLVRRIILSPELTSVEDMLRLADNLIEAGTPFLHIAIHSQSLSPGLSPFNETKAEAEAVHHRLEAFVRNLSWRCDLQFATLSEAAGLLSVPE